MFENQLHTDLLRPHSWRQFQPCQRVGTRQAICQCLRTILCLLRPAESTRLRAQYRPQCQCPFLFVCVANDGRKSEEHTSELQSLMRISYAVFCLKKKNQSTQTQKNH